MYSQSIKYRPYFSSFLRFSMTGMAGHQFDGRQDWSQVWVVLVSSLERDKFALAINVCHD
jgi:hypothetical protein